MAQSTIKVIINLFPSSNRSIMMLSKKVEIENVKNRRNDVQEAKEMREEETRKQRLEKNV